MTLNGHLYEKYKLTERLIRLNEQPEKAAQDMADYSSLIPLERQSDDTKAYAEGVSFISTQGCHTICQPPDSV